MIAYHYSVTYSGDTSLQNDFRKNYLRSEPYIRALENGNSIFTAMLLLSMYKDRVLKSEKEGKYEYAKDATEAVFEYIRKTEFPNEVSRVGCIYGTETLENAQQLAKQDWGGAPDEYEKLQILELRLDPSRTVVFDQNFYNQAYDCMVDYHGETDLHRIMELARDYFSGKRSCKFIAELLSDGKNTVLRTISKL